MDIKVTWVFRWILVQTPSMAIVARLVWVWKWGCPPKTPFCSGHWGGPSLVPCCMEVPNRAFPFQIFQPFSKNSTTYAQKFTWVYMCYVYSCVYTVYMFNVYTYMETSMYVDAHAHLPLSLSPYIYFSLPLSLSALKIQHVHIYIYDIYIYIDMMYYIYRYDMYFIYDMYLYI